MAEARSDKRPSQYQGQGIDWFTNRIGSVRVRSMPSAQGPQILPGDGVIALVLWYGKNMQLLVPLDAQTGTIVNAFIVSAVELRQQVEYVSTNARNRIEALEERVRALENRNEPI